MKIVFNLLFVAISAILCLTSAFEDTRKPFPERRELFADTNRNIIVGGQIAPQGRYTYIAGLFFSTSASLPGCGGTLIASNVVLSAAHCAGPVRVKLGCYQVNSDCTQTLSISQQIVHPSYNGNTYANDFMILVLSGAATTVSPIPFVADGTYETTIPDGQDVTVMGWGTTSSGGSQSSTLREVEVDVMTNSACQAKYTGYTIAANMICGARTGKDSCQGDSGGPLVIRCDTTKQDILVGVVSWGVGCADSRYPGVYSRVSNGWGTFIQARLSTLGVLNQLTTPPPVANACTAGTTAAPTPAPTRFPTPAPTNFPTPAPVPGTTGTPTPAPTNFPTPAPLPTVTVPPVTPGVPSGWTCTASFYNTRDGCDCECGVEDPDCDIAGQTVYNCQTGETCSGGQCVQLTTSAPTPFPTPAPTPFPPGVPAAWTCRASYYNANDGCDCNCGAFDPDCLKAGNDLYNCGSGQYCATTGVCANVPSAWTCNKEYYAHADGCDCACGTKDPDCDIPGATLYHCSTGQVCSAIGTCINSVGFSRPQPISFDKDAEQPIRKKISKMGYKPFTPYTIPEPDDA